MLALLGRAPPVSLLGFLGCLVDALPAGRPICPLWDLLAVHTCAAGDRLNEVEQNPREEVRGSVHVGACGAMECVKGLRLGAGWGGICVECKP